MTKGNYTECLSTALDDKLITQKQYDEQIDLFENLKRQFMDSGLNETEASIKAKVKAFDDFTKEAAFKKYYNRLVIVAKKQAEFDLKTYRNLNGEADYGTALNAMLNSLEANAKGIKSVDGLVKYEVGLAQRYLEDLLLSQKYKPGGFLTAEQKATNNDIIRAVIDGYSSNKNATQIGEAISKVFELQRTRFNSKGGRIGVIENYFPQIHDAMKVMKVSSDEWVEKIIPKLNLPKMINNKTGFAFTDETIRPLLKEVYDSITQKGWNKLTPGEKFGRRTAANTRGDHRTLIFKNADAWLSYADEFGDTNALTTVMDHVHSMATDIAMFDRFGPNPENMFAYLKQVVMKQAQLDQSNKVNGNFIRKQRFNFLEQERATRLIDRAENMMSYYSGELNKPANVIAARTMASIRNLLQSAQLGAASLLTPGDFNTQRITNAFNGLPVTKSLVTSLDLIQQGIRGDETGARRAIRLGLLAEGMIGLNHKQTRFMLEVQGLEATKRIADGILRVTGLSHITQSGQWGFGMEFMGHLADVSKKEFSKLHPKLQEAFTRYGISKADWNVIRNTKLYDAGIDEPKVAGQGITFLRPDDIRIRTDIQNQYAESLSYKLLNMINTESISAVPTQTAQGTALIQKYGKPGTFVGELVLSGAMYKQFPLTIFLTHIQKGMQQTGFNRIAYLSDFFISTTLLGAFANEVRDIAKGRKGSSLEYISENPLEFWGRAAATGGGFTLFGDFIAADANRYGGSFAQTLAGPVVGLTQDVYNIPKENIKRLINDKETNFGGDIIDFLRRYTPGGNIFYLKNIYERGILDNLAKWFDNKIDQKNSDLIKRYQKRGQEYWWEPGETLPRF